MAPEEGQLEVKGDFAFENNENAGKQGEGGAIYNAGALNIHDDAKFVNCSATNGGAIYHKGVLSMAGAELVISGNVVFDKCHATTAGGAIAGYEGHLSVGGSTLFTECYVLNSAASVFGGAIAWFDCNDAGLAVEIKDKVQINNCYARETTNMAMKQGAFGGAVYVNNASLSMKDATKVSGCYTSSQVNSYGGGVYAINSTGNEKSVFLKDVTFDNCSVFR